MSDAAGLPLLERARAHAGRTAIVDGAGEHGYGELLRAAEATARALLEAAGGEARRRGDLAGARVAFLVPRGIAYAAALWGTWRAGGVALPLCAHHPPRELAYVLDDAGGSLVVAGEDFAARLEPLARERGLPLLAGEDLTVEDAAVGREGAEDGPDPEEASSGPAIADEGRGALILHTSGTTSRPKGVLHTHRSLRAQVECLTAAWAWGPEDRILHVLPLHHTHGIVNALLCALWSGAACEMPAGFDAPAVWERFAAGMEGEKPPITLFMAVPTIYVKLIAAWEEAPEDRRRAWSAGARALRLMVSGSAALPRRIFARWREITGHDLLERYGMTEIGMALSNPLEGERRPGTVGRPLPGVSLRLVGEGGEVLARDRGAGASREGEPTTGEAEATAGGAGPEAREPTVPPPDAGPGEIRVRGPGLFREYRGRPGATGAAFEEGWFRTGDVASIEDGYWRILGRSSVDIIKSGGYKISALEIEEVLREHPRVEECAVVGLPDPEWGQRVAAAVVAAGDSEAGEAAGGRAGAGGLEAALDAWARERLADYKVPRRWLLLEGLPRNDLGKVTKPDLEELFAEPGSGVGSGEGGP